MSVAFNSKSEEVAGDCSQVATDEQSKYGWQSQSTVWWIGAAAVGLGLLLLTVILGLVAQNTSAICLQVGQMKLENLIYNLTNDREALRDERDQLKIHCNNLTTEMEVLQSQYNTVAATRDKLQEEVNGLQEEVNRWNLSTTGKSCYQGWIQFNNKCYYVSPNEVKKTWENSRKDCRERGADLVIVTTKDELDFVSTSHSIIWIGLSDKEQENNWKWVDGTDLVGTGFWENGEPNNSGDEDCVEVSRGRGWNDANCDLTLPWVCED